MSNTTDPVSDLLSAFGDLMPERDRLANLKKLMETTRFCCAQRDKHTGQIDHSNCEPLAALDGFLLKMKETGIAITATIPGNKQKEAFVYELCRRLLAHKCDMQEDLPGHKGAVALCDLNQDGGAKLAKYLFDRAKELGVSHDKVMQMLPVELPEMVYVRKTKDYMIKSPNGWQPVNRDAAADHLAIAGVSSRKDDSGVSEVDRVLADIRDNHAVDGVMALAGYETGLHVIKGRPVMVPSSFNFLESKPDPKNEHFPHVWAVVSGLLSPETVQTDHFVTWLKHARAGLKAGLKNGGLAALIAGDPGIGKTLLLHAVIIPALGGRSANVFANLSGSTPFSKEQAGSEVWFIDDGNPFTDREAKRAFANAIKQAVAALEVWVHGKGQDGFTAELYRRLVVLTNLDSLDAMPEMEQSLIDKIMLLKATGFTMPPDLLPLPPMWNTDKVKEFQAKLAEELPYFLDYVDHYDVPAYAQGTRFGVAYKNPELWQEVKELSHESEVHYLIQRLVYGTMYGRDQGDKQPDGSYEFEVNALLAALSENRRTSGRASTVFRNSKALGCALRQIKRTNIGKFYTRRESNSLNYWSIKRDVALTSTMPTIPTGTGTDLDD